MKRVKTASAIIAVGVLLLIGCGVRMLAAEQKNRELRSGFTQKQYAAETVYQNGAPLETLDFSRVCDYSLSWGSAAVATERNTEEGSRFALPCDISYYATQEDADGGKNPVLVLKRGETVAVSFRSEEAGTAFEPARGYGFDCTHPTYRAGWRFARPFLTGAAAQKTVGQLEEQPGYFVRTEELKRAVSAYYSAVPGIKDDPLPLFDNVDQTLYAEKKFFAPSVLIPLWDKANVALAVCGAIASAAGVLLLLMRRRKKEA